MAHQALGKLSKDLFVGIRLHCHQYPSPASVRSPRLELCAGSLPRSSTTSSSPSGASRYWSVDEKPDVTARGVSSDMHVPASRRREDKAGPPLVAGASPSGPTGPVGAERQARRGARRAGSDDAEATRTSHAPDDLYVVAMVNRRGGEYQRPQLGSWRRALDLRSRSYGRWRIASRLAESAKRSAKDDRLAEGIAVDLVGVAARLGHERVRRPIPPAGGATRFSSGRGEQERRLRVGRCAEFHHAGSIDLPSSDEDWPVVVRPCKPQYLRRRPGSDHPVTEVGVHRTCAGGEASAEWGKRVGRLAVRGRAAEGSSEGREMQGVCLELRGHGGGRWRRR